MSDRIERLRLTDAAMWEMVKEPAEKQLAFTCAAIARNAQLEHVLDAEIGCRCLTTYKVSDGKLEVTTYAKSHAIKGCNLCAGTGRVTVRQVLQRDGGER